MLKMCFLAGIRRSLTATGPDEGRPTGKYRSVRSRLFSRPPVVSRNPILTACQTETDPIPDQVQVLAQEVYAIDLLPLLANNLHRLDFEVNAPAICTQPDNFHTSPDPA